MGRLIRFPSRLVTKCSLGDYSTIQNPQRRNLNCDGSRCLDPHGEVRTMPVGEAGDGLGNLHYCHACFCHEIAWRHMRNGALGYYAYPIIKWVNCNIRYSVKYHNEVS